MDLNDETLGMQVREILDRHEVTDLIYRLGVCLDEGRFAEMGALFAEDATARTPGGSAVGRTALVAQAERNHRPGDHIQHVITNVRVGLHGDRAEARANLMVHFASPADPADPALAPPVRFTLGEVYRFGTARGPQGWRFSHVETIPVWMSGHLDRTPQPG